MTPENNFTDRVDNRDAYLSKVIDDLLLCDNETRFIDWVNNLDYELYSAFCILDNTIFAKNSKIAKIYKKTKKAALEIIQNKGAIDYLHRILDITIEEAITDNQINLQELLLILELPELGSGDTSAEQYLLLLLTEGTVKAINEDKSMYEYHGIPLIIPLNKSYDCFAKVKIKHISDLPTDLRN